MTRRSDEEEVQPSPAPPAPRKAEGPAEGEGGRAPSAGPTGGPELLGERADYPIPYGEADEK